MRQPGKQDRTGDDARRKHTRVAGGEARLDLVENRALDDDRNPDLDDFTFRLDPAGFGLSPIEAPAANVNGIGQNLVNRRDAEARAKPCPLSARIERLRYFLDAHRPPAALSLQIKAVDQPHGLGFNGIDDKFLLGAMAAFIDFRQRIAERQTRAVIEPLAGVLLHGAQDMLAVLAALIFVEQRNDLPHHHLRRIVAKFLCNGNEPHILLGELPDIHLQAEGVAKEAREGMNDDDIDRMIVVAGAFDHPLKLGPVVVHGGGAGFDIFGDDSPALTGAIGARLRLLIGNREVDLRLPRRRNPQIKRGAKRFGHRRLPRSIQDSMARSKEGVEHIAEKNLQHIDLGGGDRNLFGPVIGDDLVNRDGVFQSRIIALWRVNAITIFFVSASFLVNSSDASHAESMATNVAYSNGQITRCNATRAASKEKKAKAIGARIRQ